MCVPECALDEDIGANMGRVGSVVAADGQRMSFAVEHPLVQGNKLVVRENQIQIFECFGKEETLLSVVLVRGHLVDVEHAGEATSGATMLIDRQLSIPGILAVLGVVRQTIEHKVTFDHFRPASVEKVITITFYLCHQNYSPEYVKVTKSISGVIVFIEIESIRAEATRRASIGLVARFGDVDAKLAMQIGKTKLGRQLACVENRLLLVIITNLGALCLQLLAHVMCTKSKHATGETSQVLHLVIWSIIDVIGSVDQARVRGAKHFILHQSIDRLLVHLQRKLVASIGLDVCLDEVLEEAVAQRPKRRLIVRPSAHLIVHHQHVQSFGFLQPVQKVSNMSCNVSVPPITGHVAEVGVLQVLGAHLREDGTVGPAVVV